MCLSNKPDGRFDNSRDIAEVAIINNVSVLCEVEHDGLNSRVEHDMPNSLLEHNGPNSQVEHDVLQSLVWSI